MARNSEKLLKRVDELIANDEFWAKVEAISTVNDFLIAMMFDSTKTMLVCNEFYRELSFVMTGMGIGPDFAVPDPDDIFENTEELKEDSNQSQENSKYKKAI